MKILVVGASGFIGRHLISHLSAGQEVFAIVRDRVRSGASDRVSFIEMDLSAPFNPSRLPAKVDAVVHLAQANVAFPQSAKELLMVNTIATQQLLDYAWRAGAHQFVLASTGDVYGPRFGSSKETDAVHPASYYAATKHAAELLAQAYSDYLQVCIMRLYQPYGPGQSKRLIPGLADRIRRKEAVTLNMDDRPHLTPIYVEDVTRAIERAIESSFAGIVNIAGDRAVSVRELATEIGRVLEIEPIFEATGEQSSDFMGDNNLMKQVLGNWDMVALKDGLSLTFRGDGAIAWQLDV